jgi:hypothetical protein
MTGPIKPTSGTSVANPLEPATEAGEASRADFREALEVESTPSARPAEVSGELATLVAEVEAGRLTAAEAVDQLVDRALGSAMARGLEPAARAGLEAHLRAALAEDPVLGQLVEDLSRAG